MMDTIPIEVWHNIFELACTDDGCTGRSLSLVSTYFYDISAPFKYQSLVVTHWSQIVAFSQIFCQLPASQRKIKYLFVHHPYPFLDIEGYSSLTPPKTKVLDNPKEDSGDLNGLSNLPNDSDNDWDDRSDSENDSDFEGSLNSEEQQELMEDAIYLQGAKSGLILREGNNEDNVPRGLRPVVIDSILDRDWQTDSESGSDDYRYSEFEGPLDSEEERELWEDAEYLEDVRDGLLPSDSNPRGDVQRNDVLRDAEIQAFFDSILQAFLAILNETSSTLTILAVDWTSFKPLQIHDLLPPLPRLEELHINRCSIIERDIYKEPPTTVLFPRLLFLYISGDNPRGLSFVEELARIAPNLTHLRFSINHFFPKTDKLQTSKHIFNFHRGRMIIEGISSSEKHWSIVEKWIREEFGYFKESTIFEIGDSIFKDDTPEIWQILWASRVTGGDGPWRYSYWPNASITPESSEAGYQVIRTAEDDEPWIYPYSDSSITSPSTPWSISSSF